MIDNMSNAVNLNDYRVSYAEFFEWVVENKMDVYGVNTQGGNGSKLYFFVNVEDFTAFTLKFSKRISRQTDFFDNGDQASNYF